MRRTWFAATLSGRRPGRRPLSRPTLVVLEDRTTPSTLDVSNGVLTYTGGDVDNTLTVSFDGTDLSFANANDPMTSVPNGFTDVNGDGTLVTGPIAGLTDIQVSFGNQTNTFNAGDFSQDIGAVNFGAQNSNGGTANFFLTGGGSGLTTTGTVNVSGFNSIAIDNVLSGGTVTIAGSTVDLNQSVSAAGTLDVNGSQTLTVGANVSGQDVLLQGGTVAINAGVTASGTLNVNAGQSLTVDSGISGQAVQLKGATVAINADVSGTGQIDIQTGDTNGPGDDLTVAGNVTISTSGNAVTLFAGDTLTVNAGALVRTTDPSGTIFIAVDSTADGSGGNADTVGADFDAGGGATILGSDDNDDFTVSGTTAALLVDGGGGNNSHTFDAQGGIPTLTADTAQSSGKGLTTFANPGTFGVVNSGGASFDGTAGNDTFDIQVVGGQPQFQINGGGFQPIPNGTLLLNGLGGTDKLVVNYVNGDPFASSGLIFDGGGDPGDGVAVIGTGAEVVTYRPDAATTGNGVVTIGTGKFTFQNLTPLDVTAVASFTLDLPGGDDVITVAEGKDFLSNTFNALQLSGTSGGVAIESVAVWNTGTLVIDTKAVDGKDTITLASAKNGHGVANLTVRTGQNTGDAVAVPGANEFAGIVDVQSGGTVGVSGSIASTGGAVTLATTDAAAAGQDITLTATGVVSSATGSVTLSAGDNITTASGSKLTAGTALNLLVDVGSADGAGGTATLTNAVLTAKSATLSGNNDADTFLLTGYTVGVTLDGKGGNDAVTFNGTGLDVNVSGNKFQRAAQPAVTAVNVENLSVVTTKAANFSGAVAYSGSVTVNADSTTVADGTALGSGALSFTNATKFTTGDATLTATSFTAVGGPLTIGAGKTTTLTASGAASFGVTVDGPGSLAVNAAGPTVFAQSIGAVIPLAQFTVGNAAGGATFSGNQVLTAGPQTYADDVTLTAPANLFRSTAGAILFAGRLNGAANDASTVTVDAAGGVTYGGQVGNSGRLISLFSQTGTVISGGLVSTQKDQFYGGPTVYTATDLISESGPITFAGTLDADVAGVKDLTVNAGTGTVTFSAAVGSAAAPRNLTVSGSTIVALGAVTATERADFNVGVGGMTQGAGAITAKGIALTGSGNFALGTAANDVGPTGLRVSLTAGTVIFRDRDALTVDTKGGKGIFTTNGDVTLFAGNGVSIKDFGDYGGPQYSKALVNLGTGKFTVFPGQTPVNLGDGKGNRGGLVTFDAEAIAGLVVIGLNQTNPDQTNKNAAPDVFSVRPSANVPIVIHGNLPIAGAGDQVSIILAGATGLTLTRDPMNPANGFYTFDAPRKPIVFTGLEVFSGLGIDAFAVQIRRTNPDGSQTDSYAVRTRISSFQVEQPAALTGNGFQENSFIVRPSNTSSIGPFRPPSIALGDVNGDGTADLVLANGEDNSPLVTVINGQRVFGGGTLDLDNLQPGDILAQFFAYAPDFFGGVSVAVADVDGDGVSEIITGAGAGGGPHVYVRKFVGLTDPMTGFVIDPLNAVAEVASFFAYEPSFRGGVNVAAGDFTGAGGAIDGKAEIVTGTGEGGGPRVRVIDGLTQAPVADFFAYTPAFRGGVFVGAGLFDTDGRADLLTGPGFGGGPHVKVFNGKDISALGLGFAGADSSLLANFLAFAPTNSPIGGEAVQLLGVGGVSFGSSVAMDGTNTDQTLLIASPRGLQNQALQFQRTATLQPTLLRNIITQTTVSGSPVFLPGTPLEIIPDVTQLRDAVGVGGFATANISDVALGVFIE